MLPETSTQPSRPSKPITRSSIRHSLNFTSVGKALADVINKESRDREKPNEKTLKKSKDSSRRLSAIALMNSSAIPQANATVSSKSKSPTLGHTKDVASPSKTITRSTRRQSGLLKPVPACDDMGLKVLDAVGVSPSMKRSSSLRPRTAPAPTSSALPKYRPKSTIIESVLPKKSVSPDRTGTRRRLSSSEEEDKVHGLSSKGNVEEKKLKSSISPLPHRALTVKVNLPNLTPPSTPSKIGKLSTPKKASPAKVESSRPAKSIKTTTTSSASKSSITRPPSSSSSRSSVCSQSSPQTPSKSGFGFGLSKNNNQTSSPLRSTGRPAPESPLAHHTRQHSTATLGRSTTPTPLSQLPEADSEDSIEADDVELLLAPAAPLGAPTPAIPRIRAVRPQHESEPETPSRPSQFLPTRANLSYLSPEPPTSQSTPGLRPPKANGANRGSIMSWEQLANDGSQIIAQEEVEKMLSEIQAPFTPAGPSPNVGVLTLEVPESPCLSALPSPGGYGSISQVLLPDVTPSPAVHHFNHVFDTSTDLPAPMDSGTVTLLRLQVASAENTAKERLVRLQELEEQLHAAKQSRVQETEELAKQVSFLEQQLHISVEARERLDEERSAFTASLQDQLRYTEICSEQASNTAFARGQEEAAASWAELLNQKQQKWEVCSLAREIKVEWRSVREQAEVEQEFLQASRETLKVFLAMLDQSQKQVQCLLA